MGELPRARRGERAQSFRVLSKEATLPPSPHIHPPRSSQIPFLGVCMVALLHPQLHPWQFMSDPTFSSSPLPGGHLININPGMVERALLGISTPLWLLGNCKPVRRSEPGMGMKAHCKFLIINHTSDKR